MIALKIKVTSIAKMSLLGNSRKFRFKTCKVCHAIGKPHKEEECYFMEKKEEVGRGCFELEKRKEFRVIVSHGLRGRGSGFLVGDTMYIFACWDLE